MLSFWEENSLLNTDIVIIGAGIVGLSTAASIKEKMPEKSIVILEKGWLPTGASTKNAGFACFGSLTEILADLETMSDEEVVDLVRSRWNGLQMLRKRLGDDTIGYQGKHGYELIAEATHKAIKNIDRVNTLLYPIFEQEVFRLADDKIKEFGFSDDGVAHLIENSFEAQIDTGAMMNALWEYCSRLGVRIINGVEVLNCIELPDEVNLILKSPDGYQNCFTSQQAIFCTNAFSGRFFPEESLKPGRGQVLITKPIEGLKASGTFHIDEGYFYFRDYNNRILLGGGRNLDFETEETTEFELNENIQFYLEQLLKTVILPGIPFEIEKKWSGIMAFGPDKKVICKQVSDRVTAGIRLGGMGVAIGSELGEKLSELSVTNAL